jgi:hypothetical protein
MKSAVQTSRPSPAQIHGAKLKTAQENLSYWTMRRAQATRSGDRAEAGARVLIWQSQIDHLTSI